jgi:hypothetical protein
MIPLPNLGSPFVGKFGRLLSPWNFYLQQFVQAPPNIIDVTVGTSPYNYQAEEPGNISITGGTVSAITLFRGLLNVDVTGQKLIPVAINDVVRVTYSVLPTIKFLANYGQNTGA